VNKNCRFEISVMCLQGYTRTLVSSPIGHTRRPRACVPLVCCLTQACWHAHSGKHESFARNEKVLDLVTFKSFLCYKT
jgi:hypothetical protein